MLLGFFEQPDEARCVETQYMGDDVRQRAPSPKMFRMSQERER